MAFFREMDCRLAILRALNEAWEGVVGRNLSWFNQLVIGSCFKRAAGLVESTDIPLTPTLSQGERGNVRGQMGAVGWHGFAPPLRRRVELCGSGAPSGMTAQPQLVQGPNRLWMSKARPDLAREHGCSKRALDEAMDGGGQRPIGACRWTRGGDEGTRRQSGE